MKTLLAIAAFIVCGEAAHAETASSVYTDLDIDKCKTLEKYTNEGGGLVVQCKGIKDYDVFYSEGDLRGTVAFGPNAKKQCSYLQTFNAFNTAGKKMEWRMVGGKPIATILRWFTDNGEKGSKQSWLVVTKLDGKDACRSAVIDSKFPNANAVAQQKADSSASFNCEKDGVEVIGKGMAIGADSITLSPCGPAPYGID